MRASRISGSIKFQFTLPRGERLVGLLRRAEGQRFQFTLPRGERRRRAAGRARWTCFNSRSRGGSDPGQVRPPRRPLRFQFTLPRGERPALASRGARSPCFNSRSRGGSDPCYTKVLTIAKVSIHAPAGGATGNRREGQRGVRVSIHAPAGGATRACQGRGFLTKFQFTLPRGERLDGEVSLQ